MHSNEPQILIVVLPEDDKKLQVERAIYTSHAHAKSKFIKIMVHRSILGTQMVLLNFGTPRQVRDEDANSQWTIPQLD